MLTKAVIEVHYESPIQLLTEGSFPGSSDPQPYKVAKWLDKEHKKITSLTKFISLDERTFLLTYFKIHH